MYMPRDRAAAAVAHHQGPRLKEVLQQRSAWGAFFGHFCGNYFWYFLLTWLPMYLVRERKYSMEGMATVGSIAYLADRCRNGDGGMVLRPENRQRRIYNESAKACVTGGLIGATVIIGVSVIHNETVSMALLLVACMSFGVYTSSHWAITQTLAGPLAAGRWTSIQNGIGNLAGIAAPWLTGVVVEKTGAFYLAFVVAGLVALTGAFLWGVVVGPVEMVNWDS